LAEEPPFAVISLTVSKGSISAGRHHLFSEQFNYKLDGGEFAKAIVAI
jgi:hypothetical protein